MQDRLSKRVEEPTQESAGERSRGDILATAALCFMEKGYTETSIDDVARRLGATKGRVYHHFASKGDLFAAIFRAGMDMDYAAIAPARRMDGDPLKRLDAMMRAHTRQIIRSKPFQRVVWQGVQMHLRGATTPEQRETLNELIAYREDYENIFREALAAAANAHNVVLPPVSLAATMMFVALNSPIFWYAPRSGETDADIEKLVDGVVRYALGGLGFGR